jgi:hypothetical protein
VGAEILVPLLPETAFTICTSRVTCGRDRFDFVTADREALIQRCTQLIAESEGKRIKVRGIASGEQEDPHDAGLY